MGRFKQIGAMRSVFWLIGLAGVAVALALLVGHNQALVTLFWAPYRFDLSFNLVLFGLIGGFTLLYFALRAIAMLRDLPGQAQRWRAQQIERAAVDGVLDALAHQLAGRFVRAQSAGLEALAQLKHTTVTPVPRRESMQMLAHLLVAESAQSLQNKSVRDEHLAAALNPEWIKASPEVHEGALLRAARWAIEDRDVEAARSRLIELPQGAARRIQALRLKLQVSRMEGNTSQAMETAHLLAKHRAFSPEAAASIVRGLALDALREAHDVSQLRRVWDRLDANERAMPEIALAAAQRAYHLSKISQTSGSGDDTENRAINDLVLRWLEPVLRQFTQLDAGLQKQLVWVLEPGLLTLDATWLARLEQTQRQWPNNAYLQYLAGQTCMHRQLWGKAAQLLGQASHSLKDAGLLRRTWCSLAALAEERGDEAAASTAWKRAALLD